MNVQLNALPSGTARPAARWRSIMVPALRARAWLGLERLARIPTRWRRRTQQRRLLSTFDARMLADIGLTPAERWREVRKPFWVA